MKKTISLLSSLVMILALCQSSVAETKVDSISGATRTVRAESDSNRTVEAQPSLNDSPAADGNWTKARVQAILDEYKDRRGFEIVNVGSFLVSSSRAAARLALIFDGDDEDRAMLNTLSHVKSFIVVDYDDASKADKNEFAARIDKALKGHEKLVESKDDGDIVRIYGKPDSKMEEVSDVVLHEVGEILVCIFGRISMKDLANMAEFAD